MNSELHAVRFYKDSTSLCRLAGDFLADGLGEGGAAVIVSGPAHLDGILRRLAVRGIETKKLQECGALVLLDARQTLDALEIDGMPDGSRFISVLLPVLEAAARAGQGRLRVYGEMVDVLWRTGRHDAACRVEALWNAVAQVCTFSLVCAYQADGTCAAADVREICSHHTHVMSEAGHATALA